MPNDPHRLADAPVAVPANILVVGYGNSLRGDDDVGPQAAQAVAGWHLPGVRTLILHQLTPELAEPISAARAALFIDASVAPCADVTVTPLTPGSTGDLSAHSGTPQALLALSGAIYGHAPPAWWITIPAVDFSIGAPLSTLAQEALARALVQIRALLAGLQQGSQDRARFKATRAADRTERRRVRSPGSHPA